MVAYYRQGYSLREVAETFKESQSTVQRWVKIASGKRLERVDFYDKKPPSTKYSKRVEHRVLTLRQFLKEKSILGLFGPDAIRNTMIEKGDREVSSRQAIANILKRHGLVDHRVRVRRPAPPPGWSLRDLVSKRVELDRADIVERLYLRGGQEVQLFKVISLHGSLLSSVADNVITAEIVIDALTERWQQLGLPHYVQFDNSRLPQEQGDWSCPPFLFVAWSDSHFYNTLRAGISRQDRTV
jgi:transposase